MTDPSLEIRTLGPSFEAMGLVLDLMSRHPPFDQYRLARIAAVIRHQLDSGANVAAIDGTGRLVGYAGWAHVLAVSAPLWIEDRGPLQIVDHPTGAVALTIVVSALPASIAPMIRRARQLNPGVQVFFKRSYETDLKLPRKTSVANTGL
jgi:hypothetical protein